MSGVEKRLPGREWPVVGLIRRIRVSVTRLANEVEGLQDNVSLTSSDAWGR